MPIDLRVLVRAAEGFKSDTWVRTGGVYAEFAEGGVDLNYSEHHQFVRVEETSMHFGGVRYWWQCPKCKDRAACLYLYGGDFACRKCHDLRYTAQSENPEDRAFRAVAKLRRRLGWKPGVANGRGERPRLMRRKTFVKLVEKNRVIERRLFGAMAEWLKRPPPLDVSAFVPANYVQEDRRSIAPTPDAPVDSSAKVVTRWPRPIQAESPAEIPQSPIQPKVISARDQWLAFARKNGIFKEVPPPVAAVSTVRAHVIPAPKWKRNR